MTPKAVLAEANRTGSVWLGGEMEFPLAMPMHQAQHHLSGIAEQIGGLVQAVGSSGLRVVCPHDSGHWFIDWVGSPEAPLQKLERWECSSAWLSSAAYEKAVRP